MSEMEGQKPAFCAVLTPHRALDGDGIRWVMVITCLLAAIPGFVFFFMGAWPIVGFLGLDVLALYWALTHSRRDAHGFEEITLYQDQLSVRQVTPKGQETIHKLNPFWTKIEVLKDFEDRVTDIVLRSKEQKLFVGRFLNPDDKKSFASAFANALYRVKR